MSSIDGTGYWYSRHQGVLHNGCCSNGVKVCRALSITPGLHMTAKGGASVRTS